MKKIKNHFKNNAAIYLVLLACVAIICISLFVNKEEELVEPVVDTSQFSVVNVEEALKLFDDKTAKLLILSVNTCGATANYVPSLQIAQAKNGYNTYYLELSEITESTPKFEEFLSKLDYEYKMNDKTGKFSEFIENTPSTIIIKNQKMVYGKIGTLSTDTLETLTDIYGVSTNHEEM